MRAGGGGVAASGPRPASRARARSPNAPVARQGSSSAAYGFQGSTGERRTSGARTDGSSGSKSSSFRGAGAAQGVPAEAKAGRTSRLQVVVRKRPMNRKEMNAQQQDVVLCRTDTVVVREPKLKVDLTRYVDEHRFVFDQAFDETSTNDRVYRGCVRPLIAAVFDRAKCTCFAYGQTGSGKTHTMMGPPGNRESGPDSQAEAGIFLLAARDIFQCLAEENYNLGVYISFYEIYCGKLYDLLNNRQLLQARENAKQNVIIVGLREQPVSSVRELMEVIEYGLMSRTTGVTGANVDSSRSHAVLQICLRDRNPQQHHHHHHHGAEHGKISFIDLAGSERGADVGDQNRQTRMDGAEINKSLLALKECIRALDQQLDHTPFRGSKLTQVLKDSLVGDRCRTVMIANVNPCACAVEHSLNTLRYGYRVKELRRGSAMIPTPVDEEASRPSERVPAPPSRREDIVIEEESSDSENSEDISTPPGVQQQQRIAAHLIEVEQSLSSPKNQARMHPERASPRTDNRLFAPRTRLGPPFAHHSSASNNTPAASTAAVRASSPQVETPPRPNRKAEQQRDSPESLAGQSNRPRLGSGGSSGGRPESARSVGSPQPAATFAGISSSPLQVAEEEPAEAPQLQPLWAQAKKVQDNSPEVALEQVNCSQAALDDLARTHDRLIGTILAEEEELITAHRQHIDSMVELIKEEMVHLNNVDRPGSDVDGYVTGLEKILKHKLTFISELRKRVNVFREHLQQESTLSRKFQSLASSNG